MQMNLANQKLNIEFPRKWQQYVFIDIIAFFLSGQVL
jgi:hypothetical protein